MPDAVRHEWMSAWLLEPFLFNIQEPLQEIISWNSSAKRAVNPSFLPDPLTDGIVTIEDVISFLVVSHHRLTGNRDGQGACDAKGHVDDSRANYRDLMPFKESLSALGPSIRKAQKLYARLKGRERGEAMEPVA